MTADLIHDLIGCAWGYAVSTEDDPEPCPEQAASITVVHRGHEQVQLKLCPKHKSRIIEETTPHGNGTDVSMPLAVVFLVCPECGDAVACKLGAEAPSSCSEHS